MNGQDLTHSTKVCGFFLLAITKVGGLVTIDFKAI